MKVICAGAPKTGTKSMTKALRILGYNTVYDIEEAMEYAFDQWMNVYDGRTKDLKELIKTVYSNGVEAVVDMPHSNFFDQFLEEWPNAKVILTVRDIDSWYESYKTMVEKAMNNYSVLRVLYYLSPSARKLLNWCFGMSRSTIGTVEPREILWKNWYKRHNSYVRTTVPSSQLLVFSVSEGWGPLCNFLEKEVPKVPFPVENRADSPHNITDKMMQDTWIAKKMGREIKIIISIACLLLIFVIVMIILWFYLWR